MARITTASRLPLKRNPAGPKGFAAPKHPASIVVLGFAAVILIGTALLCAPLASRTGVSLHIMDAFFTAVSATCVTGLTVVDTGAQFSVFGQVVILLCIQTGGLGLMTLTTVLLVATGRRLGIADRIHLRENYHHSPTSNLKTLVQHIAAITFIIEFTGALLLAIYWTDRGTFTPWNALYHGVFHSVSAFCNAGFALYPDSLIRFQGDWFVQLVLSTLIILGGLGFLVGLEITVFVRQIWPWGRIGGSSPAGVHRRLSLHTKLVLTVTAVLLAVGTISYYLLERNGSFRDMSESQALLNSWFCAVTARTAGFNAVDYTRMSGAALLCTMVLMFIGASPGSTGGGIKTSTFGILLTYGLFRWRGRSRLQAFKRSIPQETVDRASSIVISGVAVVILAASFLIAVETRGADPAASQTKFLAVLFETISAFGTVGLSLSLTPTLTLGGKFIVAALMFIGRVGPLTLALALGSRQQHPDYVYAEENVMVG